MHVQHHDDCCTGKVYINGKFDGNVAADGGAIHVDDIDVTGLVCVRVSVGVCVCVCDVVARHRMCMVRVWVGGWVGLFAPKDVRETKRMRMNLAYIVHINLNTASNSSRATTSTPSNTGARYPLPLVFFCTSTK